MSLSVASTCNKPTRETASACRRCLAGWDCALVSSRPVLPASPCHQREHAPAQVFPRAGGVAHGFRGELGANLVRELVFGVGVKPAAHGEPLGRLVAVPAVLVGQHHFHDVAAESAERGEQFRQQEKVGDRGGLTAPGHIFARRQLPPVGLADEDDSARAQTPLQQFDGAGHAPADPGGADTGGHSDLLVSDEAGSIAMEEPDLIGHAEFHGPVLRLLGEQRAQVDACAGDAVIARPGTQHLPGTAAEVEHSGACFQTQGRAEGGELFRGEGVVDAVGTFGDGEDSWDVQG